MLVRDNCDDAQAYVFIDGWVHVFVLVHGNQPGLLETFLSTVEFPGGALPNLTLPAPEATEGALEPGRYEFRAIGDGGLVNARFTVPAGWSWNGTYLSKAGVEPEEGAAIYFFEEPLEVYADPCDWATSRRTSAPSVADLMAALADQPMRSATTPINRPDPPPLSTESGWAGMVVNLTVPDDVDFADCDEGEFRSWGPEESARSHAAPGQRDLVWAIATQGNGVGQAGEYVVVDVSSFADTPADVMSEIDAILESLHVGHWG